MNSSKKVKVEQKDQEVIYDHDNFLFKRKITYEVSEAKNGEQEQKVVKKGMCNIL